jgi:UDP-N-acetylglucosamine/UDP-N-acetylgalactosamine diphosphorylase
MNLLTEGLEFVRAVVRAAGVGPRLEGKSPERYVNAEHRAADLRSIGEGLLRSGKVAVMMAAGGGSTRMGGALLRGLLPVGPVTGRSLFQLQAEKIIALRRRFDAHLRWFVMTSPSVHTATLAAFEREGIVREAEFIQQASLPVVGNDLQPIYSAEGQPLMAPTGHGGMFQALVTNRLIEELVVQQVNCLFFFQYPNLLENVCDPVMIGLHHVGDHDFTVKGFVDYEPDERVGRIAETDAGLRVIEYYYSRSQNQLPHVLLPANMGTYVMSLDFLRRCSVNGVSLPWHRVALNSSPAASIRWKAEQFVFDLLLFAQRTGLLLCERRREYAPIKTQAGSDSLQSACASLLGLYRHWLKAAGAQPRVSGATVEFSPLFALDEADVVRQVKPGTVYEDGSVFE